MTNKHTKIVGSLGIFFVDCKGIPLVGQIIPEEYQEYTRFMFPPECYGKQADILICWLDHETEGILSPDWECFIIEEDE